jgi:internalin A
LDLSVIGLTDLPASIGQLGQLQQLNISNNELTALPEAIGQLSKLAFLDLHNNEMTTLSEGVGRLSQLWGLDVCSNQLKALPEALGQLTQLRDIWVFDNRLTFLPESLRRLTNLQQLYLHDNPALGLPPEVLGPTWKDVFEKHAKPASPASIMDYYFKMREGRRPLNEVRLLLMGRGEAGKTSIFRRLIEDRFVEGEPETKGIDVRPWELRCGRDAVRAHVWDFAGQVVAHATHQFFLSHRSVYVLVFTGRADSEKQDAEYWLRLIRAFGTVPGTGQTSPVIVALNKWELAQCKVDRNALQEKYPFIVGFVETDCRSARGIADLNKLIRETVDGMASVREAFPQAWFAIKERLATMKVDYVSYGEFRAQCRQLGESDAGAQDSLARVLHLLCVALNYAEDERLREATVLDPHWVTNGIYTLLRDAARERGIMTLADVARALPQEKPGMRRYLVELMRRFDLAFPLTEAGDEWLVPQRLPPTQPKLEREWQEPDLTRLRYTYTALPEGLIPRFITRNYPLSEAQQRWVNGVVLVMDDARALVRADQSERCVTAAVSGSADGRRRLAGLVREDLRRIHADMRGLDPLEEMELEGKPGEWVRVQTLEADERKKQPSAAATREGTVVVNNTSELNRVSAPAARDPTQRKAKVFISYSSRDARQHDELTVRLKPLRSEGLVETWSDRCLVAGEEWDKIIRHELEEADVIVLLWSAQFEASDYVQGVEVKRAVERAEAGETVVVSIILEKSGWERTAVAKYQVLPRKGRPVRDRKPIRDAWYEVQEGLRKVLEEFGVKSSR